MKNKKRAFSLTEIGITTAVIGVLIAGISLGKGAIDASKRNAAIKASKNSDIANIPNMTLWLDACAKESFIAEFPDDNSRINKWNDVNPNVSAEMLTTAHQNNQTAMPIYLRKGINNLPALKFDGIDDFLNLVNGNIFVNTNFTIFVVEKRNSVASTSNDGNGNGQSRVSNSRMIGSGVSAGNYQDFSIGYSTSNSGALTIVFGSTSPNNAALSSDIPAYNNFAPKIHTGIFSNSGLLYYINSNMIKDKGFIQRIGGFQSPSIGKHVTSNGSSGNNNYFYAGNIGEIIIFSRELREQERVLVEQYLRKKWGI